MTGPRTTDVKITSFFIRPGEPDYGESKPESNRFAHWRRPNGTVRPPRSNERAIDRTFELAEQRQRRRVAER